MAVATVFACVAVALLLVRDGSAPVVAAPPAAEAQHVAPEETEAEQLVAEQAPPGPPAPSPKPPDAAADEVTPSEQANFRSRKALETIDPRELLRQRAISRAHVAK